MPRGVRFIFTRASRLVLVFVVALAGSAAGQAAPAPKLVVLVVVDQMRADYVDRFARQWTGGLHRLIEEGAWFRRAAYPFFFTVTCAGHATISTGMLPATHGIIGNNWHDRATGTLVPCATDPASSIVSYGPPVDGGRGPAQLLVPTLADELRAQRAGAPRVVSLAEKPRSAVMLAGHRGDAVTWFERTTWATSTAYAAEPVPFIERFIAANPVEQDLDAVWTPALADAEYLYGGANEKSRPLPGWTPAFPHRLAERGASPDRRFYRHWITSPFADRYVAHLATAAVDALDLGQRDTTDLLAIGFSALDRVGHRFGPRSHEVQDVLVRLDRALGELFSHLDGAVGTTNYVVALSGDHGVAPIPERLAAEHFDAGRIPPAEITRAADEAARRLLGPGQYVARLEEGDLYFQPGVYHKLLDTPGAIGHLIDAVRAVPGVLGVYRGETIRTRRSAIDPIERALASSYHAGRSGDLIVALKPYWTISSNAAAHGTGYGYDTHVPILLMGPGIVPGRYLAAASPADIAPTLAFLSQITLSQSDGRVLGEAIDAGH